MKKFLVLFLVLTLFSCKKSDIAVENEIEQIVPERQDFVTDASGVRFPFLDPPAYQYCGFGWGRKFCRFLAKYDGTTWADPENYYSDFSDIRFSNFNGDSYFVSFFNIASTISYCEAWKLGETNYEGLKWTIEIIKDQEDEFWFEYDYYGSGDTVENTITYKYEVIDGLLHFSSTDGQTFIFHPSERNYSEDVLDTDEVVRLEGCMF